MGRAISRRLASRKQQGSVLRGRSGASPDEPIRIRPTGRIKVENLDQDAVKIIRRLRQHGYIAYLVGGCVRDLLLEHRPKDFDIATAATPRQVKRLFRNSRIIGRRFRLVHITFGHKVFDVSTFRAPMDSGSQDDPMIRHDNTFGTAAEDARRRDFTINGLFYDVAAHEVIDYVGGLRDLERRTIETIGDPGVRFREDPVRMLRAIKFAGRLRFHLADDVYQAIIDNAPDIRKAAAPRLFEEVVRILNRGGAEASLRLLLKTGMLAEILPEVAAGIDRTLAAAEGASFWSVLAELDRRIMDGEAISHVVMLACLLVPALESSLYPEDDPSGPPAHVVATEIDQVLRPFAARLHVSRRDLFGLKQLLLAQRRLLPGGRNRRRKPPTAQFMRRDYFEDALALFRLHAVRWPRLAEALAAWEGGVGIP